MKGLALLLLPLRYGWQDWKDERPKRKVQLADRRTDGSTDWTVEEGRTDGGKMDLWMDAHTCTEARKKR